MEVTVSTSEFDILKDTVWKLSSRVLLLEGFIKNQFGTVFLHFCENEVNSSGGVGEEESAYSDEVDEEEFTVDEGDTKVFSAMPAMIPISANVTISCMTPSSSSSNNSSSSTNAAGGGANKNNNSKSIIPPPPPLSCIRSIQQHSNSETNNSSSSNPASSYQHKPRNFLPKSLAAKPRLFSAASNNGGTSSAGSNIVIKQEVECVSAKDEALGITANHSNSESPEGPVIRTVRTVTEGSGGSGSSMRKSPAISMSKPSGSRSSFSNKSCNDVSSSFVQIQPKPSQNFGNLVGRKQPVFLSRNNFHEPEFVQDVNVPFDSESEEDLDGGYDGFLASDLVATSLAGDGSGGGSGGGPTPKRMKYSSPSFASTSGGGNLSVGGTGGGLNGTAPRQMRPNPCHTRCQNRCHDIWTDGDRMGVFETYWSIPSEEERRDWVAQRIERVDMATKRTEFSNFRTCTFKYYLPHPDNPWVQVCKNFFLATIDEKRSYIEKIAQSVKGETEKLSAKDIPFRRRNQMRSGAAGIDFVGWMTGPGEEHAELDPDPDGEMGEGMMINLEMEDVGE